MSCFSTVLVSIFLLFYPVITPLYSSIFALDITLYSHSICESPLRFMVYTLNQE